MRNLFVAFAMIFAFCSTSALAANHGGGPHGGNGKQHGGNHGKHDNGRHGHGIHGGGHIGIGIGIGVHGHGNAKIRCHPRHGWNWGYGIIIVERIWIPGHYEVIAETVVIKAEWYGKIWNKHANRWETIYHPPVYETVEVEVWIPSHWEWR